MSFLGENARRFGRLLRIFLEILVLLKRSKKSTNGKEGNQTRQKLAPLAKRGQGNTKSVRQSVKIIPESAIRNKEAISAIIICDPGRGKVPPRLAKS